MEMFGHLPPLKTKKGSSFKESRMEGDYGVSFLRGRNDSRKVIYSFLVGKRE